MAFYHCKNCPAREPGCHAYCEDYLNAKKEHEEAKAYLKNEDWVHAYQMETIDRMRENRRKRRHREDWK